jgi:glyoxylase-like metal-dependent hydrolase (beta-lactamase superfamily II)
LTAIETPGHAYHHHAYLDDATGFLFTGDALGVRLQDAGVIRPATPPPEFHLEKAIASIERIATIEPVDVLLTHFGAASDGVDPKSVKELCDEAIESLITWAEWIKEARKETSDLDEAAAKVRRSARTAMEGELDEGSIERMEQTTSYRMNTMGYMRYFDKLEAAAD